MKKIIIFFLISISTLIFSCTTKTHYILNNDVRTSYINQADVLVFSTIPKDRNFTVIGFVAVDVSSQDGLKALTALREEAASIGANAVIDVKLTMMSSYSSRTGLSGTAVFIQN